MNRKLMPLQMAKHGENIVKISEDLGLEWAEVSGFLHSKGVRGFQGCKCMC